ncbi:ring-cleaving dioxygenase [Allobacillus halotolerans]|uniref:Ring-cleaving dioxygenase n=1 Tax=Allobacillus halotolerans TaxID=570278 RepID=A0ABS6GS37_9BACI|nr:ring-cleaving dioxygenase [Allobacillus halotolerans]MBU6081942.1 ring-cleaving dioxygenase [Allobacillus halotolerans]
MAKQTRGIHHISAIVGHPQENVDFYAGVLGLRLVKKTVNFDDPGTYHLYFGDEEGSPGTIITFFPWANGRKGRIGDGQVGVTTYVVPIGSLEDWRKRLESFQISIRETERFGETYLQFDDPHGLHLELVEREARENNLWEFDGITPGMAIKGFGGGILYSSNPTKTANLLEDQMGLTEIDADDEYIRYQSQADIGNIIDVKMASNDRGMMGVGTVHHIAWRATDDNDLRDWQEHLHQSGFGVTEVKDRNYFNSIYFKEHGGILFEMATDSPGFAIDENRDELGSELKLPPQYENLRDQLTESLYPIEVRKRSK